MIEKDTIKLLRECDAGVKMGVTSIDDVVEYVTSSKFKELLSVCKDEHKKLENEKLDKILEAGRIAPTAKNNQPIKIYVRLEIYIMY